jgi:hypothetical protein
MSAKALIPYGNATPQTASADTYYTILTAPGWDTYHLRVGCSTHDALVKIGAETDSVILVPAESSVELSGVVIPAGTVIYAKNAAAGDNFTNLVASVW